MEKCHGKEGMYTFTKDFYIIIKESDILTSIFAPERVGKIFKFSEGDLELIHSKLGE